MIFTDLEMSAVYDILKKKNPGENENFIVYSSFFIYFPSENTGMCVFTIYKMSSEASCDKLYCLKIRKPKDWRIDNIQVK